MIPVREFSSSTNPIADLQAHYKALRARLYAPRAGRVLPPAKPVPAPPARTPAPIIRDYLFIATIDPVPAEERAVITLRNVAAHYRLPMSAILGDSRKPIIVTARWTAIARVADENPEWGICDLAEFFQKDHSTVINALRSMGIRGKEEAE